MWLEWMQSSPAANTQERYQRNKQSLRILEQPRLEKKKKLLYHRQRQQKSN